MPTHDRPPRDPLLSLNQLIFLHTVAIAEFGGAEGIRDRRLLESALARPLSGFASTELFNSPFARAAALFEAILRNHGFVDGNKRTAVLAAAFWLHGEGYDVVADQDEVVELALAVAEHRLGLEETAGWFETHSIRR